MSKSLITLAVMTILALSVIPAALADQTLTLVTDKCYPPGGGYPNGALNATWKNNANGCTKSGTKYGYFGWGCLSPHNFGYATCTPGCCCFTWYTAAPTIMVDNFCDQVKSTAWVYHYSCD